MPRPPRGWVLHKKQMGMAALLLAPCGLNEKMKEHFKYLRMIALKVPKWAERILKTSGSNWSLKETDMAAKRVHQ